MTLRPLLLVMLWVAFACALVCGQSMMKPTPSPVKSAYQRGSEALSKGDFETAIASYGTAIELDPKNASAYAGRGAARRLKGDFEGALVDLNQSIGLNPNVQASYYTRAWVNLILDHGDAAYADATKVLSFNESSQMMFPSHVLIAYFGLRQAKRDAEADAYLKTAGAKLYSGSWSVQIIRYLKGEVSDDQLFSSASGNKAMLEARTYVGMNQLLSGKKESALSNFRWATTNGDRRAFEYSLAKGQMGKLNVSSAN